MARWIRHFADLRVCLQIASDAILSRWMPGSEGADSVGRDAMSPGVAGLVLVEGVPLLHPEPQMFEAMLEGWRNQMLARNLAVSTITSRTLQVRAFQEYANVYPWEWSASLADEWFADLRSIRHCVRSTVRGYQVAIRGLCSYVIDPATAGWLSVSAGSARTRCR
jgi:integrase/recombinase XerC